MSANARMSQTSVSGLVGDSANSSFVFGLTARRHSFTSVCETKVDSTPNFAKSPLSKRIVVPKTLCEQIT